MRGEREWSGVEWSGVEWSGVEWSGVEWSGVEWSGGHLISPFNKGISHCSFCASVPKCANSSMLPMDSVSLRDKGGGDGTRIWSVAIEDLWCKVSAVTHQLSQWRV